jgi:hypothetical protein
MHSDDKDDWYCMPTKETGDKVCPYGDYSKEVYGGKAQDTNDNTDYFSFETRDKITAGQADILGCDGSWEANFFDRVVNFEDGSLERWGPTSTTSDYTTSESLSFTIGSDSVASITGGWSHSVSESGVKVTAASDTEGSDEQIDHHYEFKNGGNVASSSFVGWIGNSIDVAEGTSSVSYVYDDKWAYRENCGWYCTNNKEFRDYGTAYWSV